MVLLNGSHGFQASLIDILLFLSLFLSAALALLFAQMNWRLGAKIIGGLVLLSLASFQNCSAPDATGGSVFGSQITSCPPGQSLNVQGYCVYNPSNTGFYVTILSPNGTGTLPISTPLNVQGSCVQSLYPVTVSVTLAGSGFFQTQSSDCTSGGNGSFSVVFGANSNGQVVPQAGIYTLTASAQGNGQVAQSNTVTVIFGGGIQTLTIGLQNFNTSAASIEDVLDINGGHVVITGSCDLQNTDHIVVHRYGHGPLSSTSEADVGGAGAIFYCSSGSGGQGTYTASDSLIPSGASGYDNWEYQTSAYDSPGNGGTPLKTNRLRVFVRPKSKGFNSDDVYRILYAASSLLNFYTYRNNVLTASSVNSDPVFTRLLDFQNATNASYGLFQAGCSLQAQYGASGSQYGVTATEAVCSALFGGDHLVSGSCNIDPTSYNLIWQQILNVDSDYLLPANAPALQLTGGQCPAS